MSKKDISSPSKEKEDFQKKLRLITPDKFVEFFQGKGIDQLICPICKHGDVAIPTMSEPSVNSGKEFNEWRYVYPSLTPGYDSEDDYTLNHYSYRILCKNCAYEMHFNVNLIISWAEKNNGDHDE
ncbi:hypothetical protein [Xenorhabdus bovienii]|uniref:hypothetical protein n=1 Tax=Xenorhabdus bovienii TaxID=40576 RepID=UPI0023B2D2EC|nr:hypothetical protein [Xenorhabdus bovienii]MDE9455933.1 hypothetical protein [Xenorhabdus bovienii]MDE9565895.1 hypothetical protein [Xenorhabdus bovienii]